MSGNVGPKTQFFNYRVDLPIGQTIIEYQDSDGVNKKFEYNLKKKNWFNIGGKSKVFYKAENLKELIIFLKKLENKEKVFILGAKSILWATRIVRPGATSTIKRWWRLPLLSSANIFITVASISS